MQVVLRDIKKYFGDVKANDGITINLEEGKIYGLLGENGAGKSTLMKVLSGYHQPDSGMIELDGKATLFGSPAFALSAGVGMIYQDPLDVPDMRVVENYLLGRDTLVRLDKRLARRELVSTASAMSFEVEPNAFIDELSLGERQQLELLRLLAMGAELLILDEPTTGISGEQKEGLFGSIRDLAKKQSKTVILVSHKLSEVQELCDQVFVLRRGKLVGESEIPCPTEKLVGMMFEEVPPKQSRVSHVQEHPGLELHGLQVTGERLAIEGIDLVVRQGEVFGLAGLEGSGQLLLMQACAGLLRPTRGQIVLHTRDVSRSNYHQMRSEGMAFLPAGRLEEGLVGGLTVREHVALANPAPGFIVDWEHFDRDSQKRIERYQVVGKPSSLVDGLSGGNQQRTLFALLGSPLSLLLLEHPTRGLDVRSADWIWQLLLELTSEGTTIMFISADLDELVERSDRIAAFSGGVMSRIVDAAETTADELGHLIGGEA
jgi:simple sugar transport system ATP-binding protein